jgi:hypothetical protein
MQVVGCSVDGREYLVNRVYYGGGLRWRDAPGG